MPGKLEYQHITIEKYRKHNRTCDRGPEKVDGMRTPDQGNINVLRYIPNNKMAAASARIRFAFFIIIILYNESRL